MYTERIIGWTGILLRAGGTSNHGNSLMALRGIVVLRIWDEMGVRLRLSLAHILSLKLPLLLFLIASLFLMSGCCLYGHPGRMMLDAYR